MRVLVTSKGNLQQTADRLREEGMQVESVLHTIGVISGHIQESKLPALKKIEGITVEPDETVQIPPPDSALQ